jgi:ferredoxin
MRVVVDHEKCIASGDCVAACPDVFAQDEAGIVVLLDAEPSEELRTQVENAINGCPTACIDLNED